MKRIHATTIVAVRRGGEGAIAGDGQVTLGDSTVIKHGARKVRALHGGKVLAGFAGSAADAFTLFEKFEEQLASYHGNLLRAAVELAKEWRTDRVLRRLEALLVVMDRETLLVISGDGDVIEPDDGVVAIGLFGANINKPATTTTHAIRTNHFRFTIKFKLTHHLIGFYLL